MNLDDLKKNIGNERVELNVKRDIAFQVGKVLEEARTIQGVTQVKLAEMIGTTQPVIARIENGNRLPSLTFLNKIAIKLGSYLIPPKFGFMENDNQIRITDESMQTDYYHVPSSAGVIIYQRSEFTNH